MLGDRLLEPVENLPDLVARDLSRHVEADDAASAAVVDLDHRWHPGQ